MGRKPALSLEIATPIEEFTPTPSGIVPKVAPADPLADLLDVLDPVHISSVLVGRDPRVAIPASPDVPASIAHEVAKPPRYFAQSNVKTMITPDELAELLVRGATKEGDVQRIHVPPNPNGTIYSVRCAHCRRWIACVAREGACVCGQDFCVTIDPSVEDGAPEGRRCASCGARHDLGGATSSWRRLNAAQSLCPACASPPRATS